MKPVDSRVFMGNFLFDQGELSQAVVFAVAILGRGAHKQDVQLKVQANMWRNITHFIPIMPNPSRPSSSFFLNSSSTYLWRTPSTDLATPCRLRKSNRGGLEKQQGVVITQAVSLRTGRARRRKRSISSSQSPSTCTFFQRSLRLGGRTAETCKQRDDLSEFKTASAKKRHRAKRK